MELVSFPVPTTESASATLYTWKAVTHDGFVGLALVNLWYQIACAVLYISYDL